MSDENGSTKSEQAFLLEMQTTCLQECRDYLGKIQENLANIPTATMESLAEIQKALHSMKGNTQAVSFPQLAEYVHEIESVLLKAEKALAALGRSLDSGEIQIFEFLLSGVFQALTHYVKDLETSPVDSPELKAKRVEPLEILSSWIPTSETKSEATSAPAAQAPEQDAPASPTEQSQSAASSIQKTAARAPIAQRDQQPGSLGLYLLFQNGVRHYAIPIEYVVEVVKSQPLSSPPAKRDGLEGLLNLRGEVLPVVEISGAQRADSERPIYVVVSSVGEVRFGFHVEQVTQVVSLDAGTFQPLKATIGGSADPTLSHLCRYDGKTVSVLNLDSVVAA